MPAACAAVPGFPPVCNSYLDSIIYFENYNPSVHTDPFFTGICFLQESVFYRNLFFTGHLFPQRITRAPDKGTTVYTSENKK